MIVSLACGIYFRPNASLSSRRSNNLRLPLSTTPLLILQHPRLRRSPGFERLRLEALADTSHLRLYHAGDVMVAVLGHLDEDVVEVREELGYSCHCAEAGLCDFKWRVD
jgi:hypothetical protein